MAKAPEKPTKMFEMPLILKKHDMMMSRFHVKMPKEIRGPGVIEFNPGVLPGDFELANYEVTGKMTVSLTIKKRKPNVSVPQP